MSAPVVRRRKGHADWPDPRVLQGEIEYLVSGSEEALNAIGDALPEVAERLADDLLLLNFGNAVGFFDIPGFGRVRVRSGKWDDRDFERMLADLTAVAAGLPFGATTTAALPYERTATTNQDILYHAFIYLRHILSDSAPPNRQLLRALGVVLRDPHRRFTHVRRQVSTERSRRVDAGTLIRMISGRQQMVKVQAPWSPVARAFGGRLPERVDEGQVEITRDTPENRFVKSFLRGAGDIIEQMRRVVGAQRTTQRFQRRVLSDCEEMERKLRPVTRHSLWKEVGPMVHLSTASTVLQQRRGYREVLGHFVRLRLATRVPFAANVVRDLLEGKDIAELYELWTYFVVVTELEALLGRPQRADRPGASEFEVKVPWDFEVCWGNGTRVFYNRRFSRSKAQAQRSYSVPLRPDLALELATGPNRGLHLMDAKFKLEKLDEVLPSEEADDEAPDTVAAERKGVFKRGDLYKMHTYRDAIPTAQSVWILYPGSEFRYFTENEAGVVGCIDDLRSPLSGVGAIPLSPRDSERTALRRTLSTLLGAETSS